MSSGQYAGTRMGSNGVESPTYIQLENAAIGKTQDIYSPPNAYKQEYNDHHIYSVKNGPKIG